MSRQLLAELLFEAGEFDAPRRILNAIVEDLWRLPPESHAQYERILGKAFSRAARKDDAASHFERAERIYTALGNVPGLTELSKSRASSTDAQVAIASSQDRSDRAVASNVLQSATTILAHHDQPAILALEIVALLDQIGGINAKAVRRTPAGESLIVATCDRPDTHNDSSCSERREFAIGVVGDCRFEVI